MSLIQKYKYEIGFAFASVIGIVLRFYHLDYQSLWHDELFTLNLANPDLSIREMFHLISLDTHPPLYVVLERMSCWVFGYTPWAARFTAAFLGVLTIPVMFLWGHLLADKRLGMIAASIFSVSVFAVGFSQEARDYTLLALCSALSSWSLFMLTQNRTFKSALLHLTLTILFVYTHFFAWFLVVCQGLFASIILLSERPFNKKQFLGLAGLYCLLLVLYLPCIPFVKGMAAAPAILIEHMSQATILFPLQYYYDYFGANIFIAPFLVLLPIVYIGGLLMERKFQLRKNKKFAFLIFFLLSFIICNGLPYLYGEISRPVLTSRYLILLIPIYSILLALGIHSIPNRALSYIILFVFMCIEVTDVIFIKKHYTRFYKEQVREITAFITEGDKSYPMINEWMAWRHQYYLKKFDYTGKILNYSGSIWPSKHNKEWMVDSILSRSGEYNVDTFWIVVINEDKPLSTEKRSHLDTAFLLVKEANYINASAQLFGRKITD
jgi:mannosyltransferase